MVAMEELLLALREELEHIEAVERENRKNATEISAAYDAGRVSAARDMLKIALKHTLKGHETTDH